MNFTLLDQHGKEISLSDYHGMWVILYFYPKDNTPGCTIEAKEFSQHKQAFEERNTVIIGISPDSIKSHCSFQDAHNLTITLLADPEKTLIQKLNLWKEKTLYGKKYMSVDRSTYIINPHGDIVSEWHSVDVKNHVDEVLKKLIDLQ